MGDVRVRKLESPADFERIIAIQKAVWKHRTIDLTSAHQLDISVKTGAILLGAWIGRRLVGFVYSFPAVYGKKHIQHSRQLAILPEFRGLSIGKRLKWAQRREALRRGYDLITWTADPLLARNANLNFHSLGALSRVYRRNHYTTNSSLALAPGVPTDRLIVEWAIGGERVEKRRRGAARRIDPAALTKILERQPRTGSPGPGKSAAFLGRPAVLIEIPADVGRLRKDIEALLIWQGALRRMMERSFASGYAVIDFIFGDRCYYVLERNTGGG